MLNEVLKKDIMNILFISALSSKKLIEQLHVQSGKDPGFAVQKFNRLVVHGLVGNNSKVTVLSAPPVGRHNSSKVFWFKSEESEDGITYRYLSFINFPVIRQACLTLGAFFRTLFWCFGKPKSERAIVCDVLNAGLCASAILACKLTSTQIVGIMTDMPGLMVQFGSNQEQSLITKMATKLMMWSFGNYNKFVFLTEAMNEVNRKNMPYIVMEGLSDSTMALRKKTIKDDGTRSIMYAGGLHERYGLKKLTDAFMAVPGDNLRLHLYGSGPFVEELKNYYCKKDKRISYMGVVSNDEIIKAELSSDLLVNPRPSNEEFTKYSFPSKNIEYMSSGTPLLTTKLPGMPPEYYPYVYLIENETIEGYTAAITRTLSIPGTELQLKGNEAKSFILENKNCYEQAKRIVQLIQK